MAERRTAAEFRKAKDIINPSDAPVIAELIAALEACEKDRDMWKREADERLRNEKEANTRAEVCDSSLIALRARLAALEWGTAPKGAWGYACCPVCMAAKDEGHREGCWLNTAPQVTVADLRERVKSLLLTEHGMGAAAQTKILSEYFDHLAGRILAEIAKGGTPSDAHRSGQCHFCYLTRRGRCPYCGRVWR